jgi:AAA15 family ATPase/GTPase
MISAINVTNFRGFGHLELHGLKRINVIVGKNASGKTGLLESIFLASGTSPENAFRLHVLRGLGQPVQITADRNSYESLWKDLFHNQDQNKTIEIDLVGSPENTRSVAISYRAEEILLPIGRDAEKSAVVVPITFCWNQNGKIVESQPKISNNGLSFPVVPEAFFCSFFSSTVMSNPSETAARWSELDVQGKAKPVAQALRRLFGEVLELSIQVQSGISVLYATVPHLSFKAPLGVISGGVHKLASILLAVAARPHTVVLIDEVENGIHYSLLPELWKVLLETAKDRDSQVFASTHSEECLRAISSAIRENEDDFALIRTERNNGSCVARCFSGKQFESALQQNVEVR